MKKLFVLTFGIITIFLLGFSFQKAPLCGSTIYAYNGATGSPKIIWVSWQKATSPCSTGTTTLNLSSGQSGTVVLAETICSANEIIVRTSGVFDHLELVDIINSTVITSISYDGTNTYSMPATLNSCGSTYRVEMY